MRPSLVTLAIVLGIVLRLVQYVGNRSLWLDEVFLSYNILGHSARELAFLPLKYGQVAPLGFLELERLAVIGFGPDERTLRLWPLLAGLCALPLFARLARRLVPSLAAGAVALFAVAPPLIYYSSEVKPYAFDVLAAVAFALIALLLLDAPVHPVRWAALAVCGAAAPWLSLTAVFGMAAAATVGVAHAWIHQRRDRFWLMGLGAVWAVSVIAAVRDARLRMEVWALPYMRRYWAPFFFPLPPKSLHDAAWLVRLAHDFCATLFASPGSVIIAGCAVLGIGVLLRLDRWGGLAVALPAVFALAASALHQYPLEGRLALFLAPVTILGVVNALSLLRRLPRFGVAAASAACVVLMVPPVESFARNPTAVHEDLRPVVVELAARREAGDVIYVYCASDAAFGLYAARYGVSPSGVDRGSCDRAHFDRYRGQRRVWVVASEYTWASPHEPPASFAKYVATLGVETDSIMATGAWARLYDLSAARIDPATGGGQGKRIGPTSGRP